MMQQGEQGWHSGESTCIPPLSGPGLILGSGITFGVSLLLVLLLSSNLYPEGKEEAEHSLPPLLVC